LSLMFLSRFDSIESKEFVRCLDPTKDCPTISEVEFVLSEVTELSAETLGAPTIDPPAETLGVPTIDPLAETLGVPTIDPLAETLGVPTTDPLAETLGVPMIDPLAETLGVPMIDPLAETLGVPTIDPLAETLDPPPETLGVPTTKTGTRPKKPGVSSRRRTIDPEKKQARLERNRETARLSRIRQRNRTDYLLGENARLEEENAMLRKRCILLHQDNVSLHILLNRQK
jgi:hypothetical protein